MTSLVVVFFLHGCSGGPETAENGAVIGGRSADSAVMQTQSNGAPSPTPTKGVETEEVDSVYTELEASRCETTELNEDEGWSVQRCKGAFGYELEVTEGDLRQTITVIAPKDRRFELNLTQIVSSGFSSVGKKAEWRFRTNKSGGRDPFALIIRYDVSEDPVNTEKVTSYLTASKITKDSICVTDVIKPMRNANERARELALEAADKPCLKAR